MGKAGEEDTRSVAQRRADALTSLATQALNGGDLPEVRGERAHLNLTVAWNDLKADLHAQAARMRGELAGWVNGGAILDGHDISIATARMLGCDAGILPVILGTGGEVLDLGRKTATWSLAQRRALLIETNGRCGWPKCHGPADHAHHIQYWSHLGPTAVSNGVYLCTFHHHLVHRTDWTITKTPDATITVRRDPATTPTGPPGRHH
jgi:hypothetical protein